MSIDSIPPDTLIAGFDFSTGAVKGLIFDLNGQVVAEARLPTDLWTEGGVSELNLCQLEGQTVAISRILADKLRGLNRLHDWRAIGISATHHTAGRIDRDAAQVRRAICWNDQTLTRYHAEGVARLGGPERIRERIGGPWAARYSLSHLVKDESTLPMADWERTAKILSHGSLIAGYLTGNFNSCSISSAASTGMMDLRTCEWRPSMLDALESPIYRQLAGYQLPQIVPSDDPVGRLKPSLALELGFPAESAPWVFPTSDDQQAGLIGGGAVDAGQLAIILGNSAVVNSSADRPPDATSTLDAMRLNWGPYLWMRCYNNGAQFLDRVVGSRPDWTALEAAARAVPAGCGGTTVLPFVLPEPSRGVTVPRWEWSPTEPSDVGVRFRAALESLAYLMALAVREHEAAGQVVQRISVSGGIARSALMVEILASTLGRPLECLQSSEGPALGAAVTALHALASQGRPSGERPPIAAAVRLMVRFREPAQPSAAWQAVYASGLERFAATLA